MLSKNFVIMVFLLGWGLSTFAMLDFKIEFSEDGKSEWVWNAHQSIRFHLGTRINKTDKFVYTDIGSLHYRYPQLGNRAYLETILVDEKFCGKGFGSLLLQYTLKKLSQLECDQVELVVVPLGMSHDDEGYRRAHEKLKRLYQYHGACIEREVDELPLAYMYFEKEALHNASEYVVFLRQGLKRRLQDCYFIFEQ